MTTSNRRRILGAVALGAATTLAAAGCGSGGSNSAAGQGHVTLTVWSYYTGADQLKALAQQDAFFEKKYPNVKVKEVQVPGSQLDSKLLAAAAAKQGPDVFLDNVVVDFPELTAAGALAPLTKDWDSYPGRSQYPAAGIWRSKGQIYNVMSYSNLLGLYYNKDILSQYHLQPPKTLTQMASRWPSSPRVASTRRCRHLPVLTLAGPGCGTRSCSIEGSTTAT